MTLKFDPQYVKALEPLMEVLGKRRQPLAAHDVESRRSRNRDLFGALINSYPSYPDVEHQTLTFKSYDGADISIVHVYRQGKQTGHPTAALIHAHGGGMITGSASIYAKQLDIYAHRTGVQLFSVDYRLAPEHRHPTLVEDCYAGLKFVLDNAPKFNVDPVRIGLLGESAGGGIVAGVAIMALDRGLAPPLAKQILVYPMLDDRNTKPIPSIEPLALWKTVDNITGWTALLGDDIGKDDVSPYAAPARQKSMVGLPPTYIDVGELDIFKDENIDYASRISRAGIPTELHLYPGVAHAFDVLAPQFTLAQQATENRLRAVLSL